MKENEGSRFVSVPCWHPTSKWTGRFTVKRRLRYVERRQDCGVSFLSPIERRELLRNLGVAHRFALPLGEFVCAGDAVLISRHGALYVLETKAHLIIGLMRFGGKLSHSSRDVLATSPCPSSSRIR